MTTFRVFVGAWGEDGNTHDWVFLDKSGLSWAEAKAILSERLQEFEGDECETCKADASEEDVRLTNAEPGDFWAEVDGNDYRIIQQ
jgi:hypothetical protein